MAVDTRDKRAACLGINAPWRGVLPLPSGTIGAAQRRQLTGNYPFGPLVGLYKRILNAVQAQVQALALTGINSVNVAQEWMPRVVQGVDLLPAVYVCPADALNYPGILAGKDDIGFPVLVSMIDNQQSDFVANIDRNTTWMTTILSHFRYQPLTGVPEVTICMPEPTPVFDPEYFDKQNLIRLDLLFRFITRTTRG